MVRKKAVRRKVVKQTKSRGVGDTIEIITKATGIKKIVDKVAEVFDFDCGCDERRDMLNKIFPYDKPLCLTIEEFNYLDSFDFNSKVLDSNQTNKLLRIYNRVLNRKRAMTNCTSCWKGILEDLQKIYNEYE